MIATQHRHSLEVLVIPWNRETERKPISSVVKSDRPTTGPSTWKRQTLKWIELVTNKQRIVVSSIIYSRAVPSHCRWEIAFTESLEQYRWKRWRPSLLRLFTLEIQIAHDGKLTLALLRITNIRDILSSLELLRSLDLLQWTNNFLLPWTSKNVGMSAKFADGVEFVLSLFRCSRVFASTTPHLISIQFNLIMAHELNLHVGSGNVDYTRSSCLEQASHL